MISARTVVLDTSVLAELMKPRPDMAVLRWTNAQPIGTLAVTAISLAELTYAMRRMSDLARAIDLRQALDEFVHDDLANRVLPFDDLAADYYADFVWKREQAGESVDVADAQIAATCRAHGVTLATKDAAPYADLGVKTIDPWTAPPPERVEAPVLVPPPELDRHGKPIPPRRPGVGRGGVGGSRPPRPRRRRRTTSTTKKPGTGRAAKPGAKADPKEPVEAPIADPEAAAEERFAQSRRAAERLRRHVAQVQETAAGAAVAKRAAAARRAAAKAAPPEEAPRGGTGRRGARLLGPLVDAEGRPVERTIDGRIRPRKDAAASTRPDGHAPAAPDPEVSGDGSAAPKAPEKSDAS
ncbi:MAG: type II toxin-antitoxin system VapC family toxin [Patulibacter sp.]|nr:type II toxin-antitoxin system VapC family toxin [Patulibacter sp.]